MRSDEPRVPRRGGAGVRTPRRWITGVGVLLMLLLAPAGRVDAQQSEARSASREIIYQREVYQYSRDSRPDPFRSPLLSAEVGIRIGDLAVRGIVFNSNPRESVAVLVEKGTERRIRARVGERIGAMRVIAIHPRRVDLAVEDGGVIRRESLFLKADPDTGTQQ
jgi:hypothetical protein